MLFKLHPYALAEATVVPLAACVEGCNFLQAQSLAGDARKRGSATLRKEDGKRDTGGGLCSRQPSGDTCSRN